MFRTIVTVNSISIQNKQFVIVKKSVCFEVGAIFLYVIYLEVHCRRAIVQTVADFSPKRPRFDSRSIHARFVADKVAPRRVSSEYFGFLLEVSPYYCFVFRSNPNKRTNVGSLKGSVKNFNFCHD